MAVGARFSRFAAVSAASVVTGHVMLYGLHSVMGVSPVPTNVASTVANTVLVFGANRTWVWPGLTKQLFFSPEETFEVPCLAGGKPLEASVGMH